MRVLIAGGGTGGHLYPGIALARELQRRDPATEVVFVGTAAGIEARVIPREGFPLDLIRVAGLKGRSWASRVRGVSLLPLSALDAWRVLRSRRPTVVVGGAVAVPAPQRTAAADAGAGDQPGVRAPVRQGQDGLPTGALGRHSAVDNGGPRHAEPHALAALPHAPLSLVPGAPVSDTADGTRERHRDVPVFPG